MSDNQRMNIPDEAVEEYPHFPEPRPCGSEGCDQDHDGPCWTCGEAWPCTAEKDRQASQWVVRSSPSIGPPAIQVFVDDVGNFAAAGTNTKGGTAFLLRAIADEIEGRN